MASSTASDAVKAGYWFCTSELPPDRINSNLFTHLYAGFAKVKCPIPPGENIDNVIQFPGNYRGLLENFPETVKTKNPGVKALLSIGGGGPPLYVKPPDVREDISTSIAAVVATDETAPLRNKFIERSIYLARRHNYDGLDLCWLYPSNADQKPQLASLLKAWRDAVDKEYADQHINRSKLLLTATVFHHPVIQDVTAGTNFNYPSGEISAYLDWVNVLAVDFYDPFKSSTSLTGPVHAWLSPDQDQTRCGKGGIESWIANGVKSRNLVLGLPFYGHQWTLERSDANGLFAAASSAGADCQYLAFKSIQNDYVNPNPNNLTYDDGHVAAYWHSHSAWIGFDDAQCISTKVRAAKDKNLRGYLAWHVGGDDDKCTLSTAAEKAWPA